MTTSRFTPAQKMVRAMAPIVASVLLAILLALLVYRAWWASPEEAAYQALIADHPLTGVVEAVEAYTHTLVIGHEFITATESTDTLVSLWLYFDPGAGEQAFLDIHQIALGSLVEAFPDCTDYIIVLAEFVYDEGGVLQARGMAGIWFSRAGAGLALAADDYAAGINVALEQREAVVIRMGAYGYPPLIDPWYPRMNDHAWPIDAEKAEEPSSGCDGGE
jgi:hypothetical protein